MKAEMRKCDNCFKNFIVKTETLKKEKKLGVKITVCDSCQKKLNNVKE